MLTELITKTKTKPPIIIIYYYLLWNDDLRFNQLAKESKSINYYLYYILSSLLSVSSQGVRGSNSLANAPAKNDWQIGYSKC